MGAMLGRFAQAFFGGVFILNMLWAVASMKVLGMLPLAKQAREGMSLMLIQAAWRIALFWAPWMRCAPLDDSTAKEWVSIQSKMAEVDAESIAKSAPYKPLMILGNHMSFFDTILSVTALPSNVLWRCRTYMDHSLFELPILSTLCRSVGHFPVYFTSTEDGKFSVDKEKNETVDKTVNAHLASGGWLCFFPEGQMNKEPDTILPFRFGGMRKAIDCDARLMSFVSCGNTKVWPKKAKIGGLPGQVKYSVKQIAPDGVKAYLNALRSQPNLSTEDKALEDHALLAKYAQILMQQQYNELKAVLTSGDEKNKSD